MELGPCSSQPAWTLIAWHAFESAMVRAMINEMKAFPTGTMQRQIFGSIFGRFGAF